ncbi:MAG: hypothetical protein VKK42_02385 [Lyngbya sp.]|nr:hypothetical protein [Lyngbya sp.]
MSELYKVPSPEEVEALLRGDYTKDEAAPEIAPGENQAVAQCDREPRIGASLEPLDGDPRVWRFSEKLHSGIKLKILELFSCEMEDPDCLDDLTEELTDFIWEQINSCPELKPEESDREPPIEEIENLLPMDWADAIEVMARKFFDASISAGTAFDIYQFFNKCGVADVEVEREQAYRESVRQIRRESNERIEKLSKLITRLYLDLHHIEQIAGALMQLVDRYPPEELKAIASLITHQCMGSRANISSHTETEHYPNIVIGRHNERSTINPVQTNSEAGN